jgi:plastocyanin
MSRRAALLVPIASLILLSAGLAFSSVALAGGGCHMSDGQAATDASTAAVSMETCRFGPTIARVSTAQAVTFTNRDGTPHNVTGIGWASPMLEQGNSFTHTFSTAGIFPYACSLHPGMNGVVIVGAAAAAPPAPASPAAEPAPVPVVPDAAPVAVAVGPAPEFIGLGAVLIGVLAGALGWIAARSRQAAYRPGAS